MTWAGRLLVATPLLTEPTFARTVVLLLQHDDEDGALGVVVNRPSGTGVDEVLPGWQELAGEPEVVFEGGPVQRSAAICLARHRPAGPQDPTLFAALREDPSLGTVDLDADPARVAPLVARLRVFAGYAGWSVGQLEGEVDEGAWWVVDALPDDAFSGSPQSLWRRVLRRQGGVVAMASTWPDDPAQN